MPTRRQVLVWAAASTALAGMAAIARPGPPADFGTLIAEETAKWAKVIRACNIKPG